MSNRNLSGEQLKNLLAATGKKLGKSPEEIMAQVQSGNIESLTANLDAKTKNRINGLLQNPKALETLVGRFFQ